MKHSYFNPSKLDVPGDWHVFCYLWTNLICLAILEFMFDNVFELLTCLIMFFEPLTD